MAEIKSHDNVTVQTTENRLARSVESADKNAGVKRYHAIDAARGIALILVVFGHAFRPDMCDKYSWCNFSYEFVYSFHVALLFFLSGISYAITKKRNTEGKTSLFFKKKTVNILLPWFTYSVLVYAAFAAASLVPHIKNMLSGSSYAVVSVKDYLLAMITNNNPYCFHVWYLQTLFLFLAVTYLTDKYLPKYSRVIFIVLIAALPLFYMTFCETLPWVFKGFFQKYAFFLAGVLLPMENIEKKKIPLTAIGVLSFGALIVFNTGVLNFLYRIPVISQLTFYVYNAVILFTCIGITASCCFFKEEGNIFAKLGRKSMLYYLYHQPFCCAFAGLILYNVLHINAVVTIVICMALSFAVPYVISRLIRLMKLEKVFLKIGLPY